MGQVVLAVSVLLLLGLVLLLAVLCLRTLRTVGLLRWRMEQLEALTPTRVGRRGLEKGARAPDFTLPDVDGTAVTLSDFRGRPILLVFIRPGCGPCRTIVGDLNAIDVGGRLRVLAVTSGTVPESRAWTTGQDVRFTLVSQADLGVSRRYEVFATPFAFLLDADGQVAAKGIVNRSEHIGYLLGEAEAALEVGRLRLDRRRRRSDRARAGAGQGTAPGARVPGSGGTETGLSRRNLIGRFGRAAGGILAVVLGTRLLGGASAAYAASSCTSCVYGKGKDCEEAFSRVYAGCLEECPPMEGFKVCDKICFSCRGGPHTPKARRSAP